MPDTRIFINNVDSPIGTALAADMRLQKNAQIYGTLLGGLSNPLPSCVRKVVSRAVPAEFLKSICSCDVLVFDMHSTDLEEMNFVIGALKHAYAANGSKRITILVISSLMTWARTPQRVEMVSGGSQEDNRNTVLGLAEARPSIYKVGSCDTFSDDEDKFCFRHKVWSSPKFTTRIFFILVVSVPCK